MVKDPATLFQEYYKYSLEKTKSLLDSVGQQFFLSSGTLLGAYRDNAFIHGDSDIDLNIMVDKFDPRVILQWLKSQVYPTIHIHGIFSRDLRIFLDWEYATIEINLMYPVPGSAQYYSYHSGGYYWLNHIRDLVPYDFYGKQYLIPANTEEYLTESYGEDWRTPKRYTFTEGIETKEFTNFITPVDFEKLYV